MEGKTLVWQGGEHRFALRLGELRALQKNCDAGPEQIFNRLRFGEWRVDDIIEPIRLGLLGSGEMRESEVGPFVTTLLSQYPIATFRALAQAIVGLGLYGDPDDPVGEAEAGEAQSPESGASPASTETQP